MVDLTKLFWLFIYLLAPAMDSYPAGVLKTHNSNVKLRDCKDVQIYLNSNTFVPTRMIQMIKNVIFEMPWPNAGATHTMQLKFSDKGRAIKGLDVGNSCDISDFGSTCLTVRLYVVIDRPLRYYECQPTLGPMGRQGVR